MSKMKNPEKINSEKINSAHQFVDNELGTVSCFIADGVIWLKASQVIAALEIDNQSQALQRVEEEDKRMVAIRTEGGIQQSYFLSEYGMWELVLTSRKPQARAVKHWMTHVVLPSIRKNGGYIGGEENLSPENRAAVNADVAALQKEIARLSAAYAQEKEASSTLRSVADMLREENRSLAEENEDMREMSDEANSSRFERDDYFACPDAAAYMAMLFEGSDD